MAYKVNRHSIKIQAAKDAIFEEIVLWGESSWWPKSCSMKFINQGDVGIIEGTRYLMKIIPFGPSWHAQVTKIEKNYSIRRDFLDGMFSGFETVSILEGGKGGLEVAYEMFYQLNGKMNEIIWPLILEKIHNLNIERILGDLKRKLERK